MSSRAGYCVRETALAPEYKTDGAAGFDIAVIERVVLAPNQKKLVRTGLIVKPPDGCFTAIFARSSLQKRWLALANSVGVVDRDYCGPEDEIMVALWNFGDNIVMLDAGERVAQGIFMPYRRGAFEPFTPGQTSRGGFGSTND